MKEAGYEVAVDESKNCSVEGDDVLDVDVGQTDGDSNSKDDRKVQ